MRRRSLRSLKTSLVLSLLGAWAVFAPPVHAQQQTLTGWFSMTTADYPPESGLAPEMTYVLTEDSGERQELLLDIALMRPLGGPVALNRKRVTVVGQYVETLSDAPAQFRVSSIQFAASPDGTSALQTTSQAVVTGSQAWVTILCRFADSTDVTPYPVSHFEQLTGSSYPGLDHYWREVSDGNISDLTGSVVVGWYNLPRPRSYYLYTDEDGGEDFELERAVEDCTAVADADVFFPDFDGINLVFNQQGDAYGRSRGGSERLTKDGQTQFYGVTWLHPSPSGSYHQTIAHEMGHAFGLLHSSGPYGQDDPLYSDTTYDSQWDVMSGGRSLVPYPGYGYLGVHTIAYHKDFLGWIPAGRKYVAPRNSTRTITLERLAQPGSEGYLMAQIPIGDSPTDFYTVETRLFAGYDDEIPDEAVVIHKVDTTLEDRLAQVVDIDNNGDPNDAGAMWTPGEIFTDLANGIEVSVDAARSTSFQVTIAYTVCADSLSSTHQFFAGRGGDSGVGVRAPSGCSWVAVSNSSWIRITAGSSGSGNGSVSYSVAANPNPTARTGTLSIGGWTFTVTQASANDNLFEDDMENGTVGWSADSPWAPTTTASRSGTNAWTDSPGGNYQNDLYVALWSPIIDLTGVDFSDPDLLASVRFCQWRFGQRVGGRTKGGWSVVGTFTNLHWHSDDLAAGVH